MIPVPGSEKTPASAGVFVCLGPTLERAPPTSSGSLLIIRVVPTFAANALPHRRDRRRVVLRIEDRRAGHERIRTGRRDRADVVDLDAAVDFQADVAPAAVDDRGAPRAIFGSVDGMNDWPPKPGFTDISSTMSTLSST